MNNQKNKKAYYYETCAETNNWGITTATELCSIPNLTKKRLATYDDLLEYAATGFIIKDHPIQVRGNKVLLWQEWETKDSLGFQEKQCDYIRIN